MCRGGRCAADGFANGSGVTIDASGNLRGVSVNSAPDVGLGQLASTIPNRQVGVTTVGNIKGAGGTVTASPTLSNPYHCALGEITPEEAEALFTPTAPNPNR